MEMLFKIASGIDLYCLLFVCCFVFSYPLKHREHWGIRCSIGAGVWLLGSGIASILEIYVRYPTMLRIVCGFALCAGWIYATCRQSIAASFYCTFWALSLFQMLQQLWIVIYEVVVYKLQISEMAWWGINPFILLGGLILYMTLARWIPEHGRYEVGPRKMTLAILIFIIYQILVISVLQDNRNIPLSTRNFLLIMGEVYCITVLYLQSTLFKKSAMQQELDTLNLIWRQQKEQYDLSKENIALINQKCHDLKHQMAALRVIGSSAERDQYIHELQESINIYDSVVRTGNEVLDTILTEKSLYCEANEITINCVVDGKQMAFIDPVDLYTVMGNAVDNAIESVKEIKERDKRIVDVLVYIKQKFLVINIANPVEHKVHFQDGLPISTKEKNGYHGFGMKSIRHIVQKYNGFLSCDVENECFTLKILLPLPK